jgi:hypothetical protein
MMTEAFMIAELLGAVRGEAVGFVRAFSRHLGKREA